MAVTVTIHQAPTLEKQHYNSTTIENISKVAYTLPYWIKKASDGSLWFNEQEGNKIADQII
jgi:hypothetical protein